MANNSISYTTPAQQIQKLKQQGLIIQDEDFAETQLRSCGYSNLIKSYREPYTFLQDGKKVYRSGVRFEQIYSLYLLDNSLRSSVMAAMLDLEEHIKEVTADVIASSFGVDPNNYLKFTNYRDKKKSNSKFSLKKILDKMQDALNSDKEPIHHYRTTYQLVPPWILFKSVYFSTITNFIDRLKPREQAALAMQLYNSAELKLSQDALRKLMVDTLFICQEYRNLVAHGGRTYNYICSSNLRAAEIFPKPISPASGFSQLLFLLSMLNYRRPFERLEKILQEEVDRHCKMFPGDVTYLGQVLNVNIVQQSIVFVSGKSKKYHHNPHCSGIMDAQEMIFEQAIERGYVPCKRCVEQ
ncbi:MAG: Abi family protein [Lachnospiraceae bacterium]|nr:Abi family protein [Lachnospiraceae bacterium]